MKIAIFSDVHGNLIALQAVLDDLAHQQVDEIFFAGDLCFAGPRPAECLHLLRQHNIASVYGNTDDWVLGRQTPPPQFEALAQWTNEQLSTQDKAWLARLPFSRRLSPTTNPQHDLLITHANPDDVNQLIFPPETEQQTRYQKIAQTDEQLHNLFLTKQTACTIAFGHLHVPSTRQITGFTLENISSVSMAGDGDMRAKYNLFMFNGSSWLRKEIRVTYDVNAELETFQTIQPPNWQPLLEAWQSEDQIVQRLDI